MGEIKLNWRQKLPQEILPNKPDKLTCGHCHPFTGDPLKQSLKPPELRVFSVARTVRSIETIAFSSMRIILIS